MKYGTIKSVCILVFCLISYAPVMPIDASSRPEAKPDDRDTGTRTSSLVFSEVYLGNDLGASNTWIELYNTSGKEEVLLQNISLDIAGESISPFPQGVVLPPYGLVVVLFQKEPTPKAPNLKRSLSRLKSGTVYMAPIKKETNLNPKGGYCALYDGKKMIDYLHWGRNRLLSSDAHGILAKKKGMWSGSGIYIGLGPRPGDPSVPERLCLVRLSFSPKVSSQDSWFLIDETVSSPGSGNMLPPPNVVFPQPGDGIAFDQDFQIVIKPHRATRLFLSLTTPNGTADNSKERDAKDKIEPPYHIQISEDPHFRSIVYDGSIMAKGALQRGTIKPGSYYIRVRIATKSITTDWSIPFSFSYR